MARTIRISQVEIQRAKHMRDHATTIAEYRKALAVVLVADLGLDIEMTAHALGTSRRTVFRSRKDICNQDNAPKRSWGGRRHCILSLEEERKFLAPWETQAAAGGVLSVPPIHAALVERLGYPVPPSTTYRLLARHGWRKVQPDTQHPKRDPGAQEEFKKNSRNCWQPPR